ncbi:MAG: hypothetical protein V1838_05705 [Patescibacteria group bacterium]
MKRVTIILVAIVFIGVLSGCTSKKTTEAPAPTNTAGTVNTSSRANENTAATNTTANTNTGPNTICQWVDDSDVIITLKFADGVELDTSYETGFYLNSITSTMRLARAVCDYRTGFSYEELAGLGVAQVGVRGYTNSVRRQLADEPVNVVIGGDGHPDIGSDIEVTVLD